MSFQGNPAIANVVLAQNGTAAQPSISFGADPANSSGNGFFLKSPNVIGLAIGGTEVMNWSASGPSDVGVLAIADGTAALPSLSFSSDATTGLLYDGSNGLKIATNGILALTISSAQLATFVGVIQTNAASNQIVIKPGAKKITITAASPVADNIYTLPDAGGAASFVLSSGASTINSARIFSSAVTINPVSNQLVLGVTNTTTISATAPAASSIYTIADVGTSANFVMSAGAQTLSGALTLSAAPILTAASNQFVIQPSGSGFKFSMTAANPAADRVLTIPDPGGAASFVMTAGNQTLAGVKTFSSAVTVSAGITATATNDSAASGIVGEVLIASRLKSAATSVTSTTTLNITSAALSLTAGDWDVSASVGFLPAATTSITLLKAAISKTTATLPATDTLCVPTSGEVMVQYSTAANVASTNDISLTTPTCRISLAGTTNIFLVAQATFSVSTLTGYGSINARRIR